MARRRSTAVSLAYAAVAALLVADAVATDRNVRTLAAAAAGVDRTREVLGEIERALSLLKDAETGQRGYLLTEQEEFLGPYLTAPDELGRALRRLDDLTATDPEQRRRAAALRAASDAKLAELRRSIAAFESSGRDAAIAVVRTGVGRRVMDRARGLAAELRLEEERQLRRRAGYAAAALGRTVASFAATTALALALLLATALLQRRDVRARERAAEDLRRSEEWLSTTLASIGDAVLATDGDGRVRLLNPAAAGLTGWARDEARGRPVGEVMTLINEHTRRPAENPIDRVRREGAVVGLANHTVLVARDGSEVPIDDSAAPIRGADGRIVGVVMVFRDVGARKALDAEREARLAAEARARDEAEAANRAKDQFLAVLSHELRTPLNPILLATSSMLAGPIDPDEVRPVLEMVRDNVQLEARLIDDLLDVMRIAQGKMALRWGIADAHELIRRAVAICGGDLEARRIALTLDLAAELPHLNADPARLQQVIWNLVKNAAKFTPEGGAIAVRTRNEIAPESTGPRLIIEVADTGIGIEPAVMGRIFEPFQQGESNLMRRYGGLGLGLAIGRGVVEAHGGLIAAESPGPGRGSTFRIQLRALSAPLPEPAAPRAPTARDGGPPAPGRLRILLVEDEPTTLRLLQRLLERLGHDVAASGTLAAALEHCRDDAFDLVISDIGLPDGSGLDLIRRLADGCEVPAIALTGYGMDDDVRRSHEAGFAAHLTKPIDFHKLEAIIRRVVADRPGDAVGAPT